MEGDRLLARPKPKVFGSRGTISLAGELICAMVIRASDKGWIFPKICKKYSDNTLP